MSKPRTNRKLPTKHVQQNQNQHLQKAEKQPSWAVVRGLLTCRNLQTQNQPRHQQQNPRKHHNEQRKQPKEQYSSEANSKKCKKMKCSGSLCSNTKVMHRPEIASPEVHKKRLSLGSSNNSIISTDPSSRSIKNELNKNGVGSASCSSFSVSSNSSAAGSFRGMPFRRFSGCYECRMVVDPVLGFTRDPSLRSTICSCPDCGEIFMKSENLELHQATRHAVSELGPEDTSKNIVEIIFQSSWLKKESPICKIERILKVHNTQKTISRFEEYRDGIKAKATKQPKKHPRCVADGNELLRFHCTTLVCSLGLNGSSNVCNSIPQCNVCNIIKNGFRAESKGGVEKGVLTTATSGNAHDKAGIVGEEKMAMLVCRVIAGRVKKKNVVDGGGGGGCGEEYDSVAGEVGAYSNLDELYVFNPKAILPCFVVIYGGF